MNVYLEWSYKPAKGKQTIVFRSDSFPVTSILTLVDDIEKTGRVKELFFVDEEGCQWSKKEILKYIKGVEDEPHDIIVHFDGGFDHATSNAGLGIAIQFKQNNKTYRLRKNERIHNIQTNNEAEYAALWFALSELEALGAHHIPIMIKGDSLVVINQLTEEWPCYEPELQQWVDRIEAKVKELGFQAQFQAVSRKQNKEADQLATQALEGTEISSKRTVEE
ncbi:reverse transcriptase-like protein [Alkalihalobacterium bogoriense]|uniref:reverse transcriptase-like protein n=1 Tax=Alkalihalobacterium bogoriense TaxID=246272 RepID=UPI000479FF66|nr:reverse transcriptase-like protein [Alkalihalobacterium bogoriense]